ncbi:MAG: flagellar motor protein MotB [Polyangiaceae bacterium]
MARKRAKPPEHVNHERWLVSYADFITLLFAFFVVMFAVSQVDTKKVGRFTQSFHDALEWQVMAQGGSRSAGGKDVIEVFPTYTNAKAEKRRRDFEQEKDSIRRGLAKRLGTARMLEGLNILEVHGELVLRLPEKLMFDRGEAILRGEGGEALVAIAEELSERPVRIRVEGHSDSTPIRTPRFPSNWELSQSRAMAVVRFFLEDGKIAPGRLAAAGYGEYHPVATNDTVDGKRQNRRVDLIVVADLEGNADGAETTDQPAPASPPKLERQNTGDPNVEPELPTETTQ